MSQQSIRFIIHGRAQPAGSKRFVGVKGGKGIVIDANPHAKDWKLMVAEAAARAREEAGWLLLRCPVSVSMIFYRPRPQSHYNKSGLRAAAPIYPATKPDRGKLARAVEDALTGVIYLDDAQIVGGGISKRWADSEYVEIVIQRFDDNR